MTLSPLLIENMVRMALAEDLGHGHDITSQLLIPNDATAKAVFRAREEGVLAGLILALSSFAYTDPDFEIEMHAQDGQLIHKGDIIATVEGPAAALLTAERTALNFLIHLSGIATQTNRYVQAVKGTKAKICDTRKTLAGLRALQKYAVRMGGGTNHRFGLDDAILIKDNHIAIAGSVKEALKRARNNVGHMVKIEIEVDTLKQLEEVLKVGDADIVMFDNFKLPDLKKAVKMVNGKLMTEASGGVNLKTVSDIAKTGVDYISVGALTHSAPALDIGLDIDVT
jgi:nicotinate-nucleotide pyrophosphorylase (carboxylating)